MSIGGPLKSIEYLFQDVDPSLRERVGSVAFEALVSDLVETLRLLYRWLDLPPAPFDPQHLTVKPHESDSYYRWKYCHATHPAIRPPVPHTLSPRIEQEILKNFGWFFEQFYAGPPQAEPKPKPGLLQKLGL